MKQLVTERLLLRQATSDDAGFIASLMNDKSYLANIGDRQVRTVDDARSYLQTAIIYQYDAGLGFNLVELRSTGEAVGICGLVHRDGLENVDLGYAIADRFSGHGYASEAAQATLAHATETLKLSPVLAITTADNLGSCRVLEKLGMQLVRTSEEKDNPATCVYSFS